jgi:lysophospholipase L1-like esterase
MNFVKNTNPSKWQGKTWNVIGDSITEHNFRTNKNYHDYIKDKIGCTVNNYGISGTGYFTPSTSGGTNAIYQRISTMAPAELITVFAGTNDWGEVGKTFAMGALGDTNGSVSFYGSVDSTLSQLIAKYPTKTIAAFTPLPRSTSWGNTGTNSAGVTLQQVADAVKYVCNKYSIPCLDLNRNSNSAPWNTDSNNYYFTAPGNTTPDGLHPNDALHQLLADKILPFLNTL